MKHVILICALSIGWTFSPLRAGYVVEISDSRETTGKLSLVTGAVEVQTGSSPTDINFSEILEAYFGDAPFQLDFFSSSDAKGKALPPAWKAQDIGEVDAPGTVSNNDGTFTISGSGNFPKSTKKKGPSTDRLYFAGQQWLGDGQWTVHLNDIDAQSPTTSAGLMLRETLDPGSKDTTLDTSALGAGSFSVRPIADAPSRPIQLSIAPPVWLRLTRFGLNVYATVSSDGQQWDMVGQADFKSMENPWIGLFAHSHQEQEPGKATFDQISFAPAPSSAQVLPPGVILQGGSFVAATCEHLVIDSTNPDALGNFTRGTTPQNISASQIAFITSIPLTRSQIADLATSKPGLIMKNGDVMDGETNTITNGAVQVNSMLLGVTTYPRTDTRACVLHQLFLQPAKYEIRLKDGSMVHANDLTVSGTSIAIEDVSGARIFTTMDDIAQFRAGSAMVQSLAELDWKAKAAPAGPKANSPAPGAPPAGNAAAPAMAPANAAADQAQLVGSWRGPNQEQVLQVMTGTTIDFPLSGKYRAMAMQVMISSDSPPNAQAIIHVLADGKEVGTTPPFKAGDHPRFVQVTLQNTKTLSLVGDSTFDNTKLLMIDPVVIRN